MSPIHVDDLPMHVLKCGHELGMGQVEMEFDTIIYITWNVHTSITSILMSLSSSQGQLKPNNLHMMLWDAWLSLYSTNFPDLFFA